MRNIGSAWQAVLRRWLDCAAYGSIGALVGYLILQGNPPGWLELTALETLCPSGVWLLAASVVWALVFGRRGVAKPLGGRRWRVVLAWPSSLAAALVGAACAYWMSVLVDAEVMRRVPNREILLTIPCTAFASVVLGFAGASLWLAVKRPNFWNAAWKLLVGLCWPVRHPSMAIRKLWHSAIGRLSRGYGKTGRLSAEPVATAPPNAAIHVVPPGTKSLEEMAPDDLAKWAMDESPVEHLADDRLGRDSVVRRYVRLLRERPECTFALVGPHGSGKSSIMRMVEGEIGSTALHFVHVRGWGIRDGCLAEHVLLRVVDAVEELGLDCTAIRSLPGEYIEALSAFSERFSRVMRAVNGTAADPSHVVEALTPMLRAAGIRLVVCIEDIDRSCSRTDFQELCALLDRFRRVREVTVIFEKSTDTDDQLAADYVRFCDHIENVPVLTPETAWALVLELRKYCMGLADERIMLRAGKDDKLERQVTGTDLWAYESTADVRTAVRLQIADLVRTPRVLKQVCREVIISWRALRNEIDFTDLFMGTALKCAAPPAYGFLAAHIRDLQAIDYQKSNSAGNDAKKRELCQEWDALPAGDWDRKAAGIALAAIGFNIFEEKRSLDWEERPQGFTCKAFGRYWRRFQAGELDPGELEDKEVLPDLREWIHGGATPEAIASKCAASGDYQDRVAQFLQAFLNTLHPKTKPPDYDAQIDTEAERIRRLMCAYHAALVDLGGVGTSGHDLTDMGLVDLVRERAANVVTTQWLLPEMTRTAPRALPLALSLFRAYHKKLIGMAEAEREVAQGFADWLRSQLPGTGAQFWCRSMPSFGVVTPDGLGDDYDEHHQRRGRTLITLMDCYHGDQWQLHVDEWSWLVPSLLDGANQDPLVCIPPLVYLLVRENTLPTMFGSPWTCSLDFGTWRDFLRTDESFLRLRELLERYRQEHRGDKRTCRMLDAVWAELSTLTWDELVRRAAEEDRQRQARQAAAPDTTVPPEG